MNTSVFVEAVAGAVAVIVVALSYLFTKMKERPIPVSRLQSMMSCFRE
jgi:hypothetical protein